MYIINECKAFKEGTPYAVNFLLIFHSLSTCHHRIHIQTSDSIYKRFFKKFYPLYITIFNSLSEKHCFSSWLPSGNRLEKNLFVRPRRFGSTVPWMGVNRGRELKRCEVRSWGFSPVRFNNLTYFTLPCLTTASRVYEKVYRAFECKEE